MTASDLGVQEKGLGPASTLEALYRSHGFWLLSFLRRRFGLETAEELAQEAFVRSIASPTEIRNPRAFLATLALRAAADQQRREAVRPALVDVREADAAVLPDQVEQVLLQQLLRELPRPVREVYLLSRVAGLTYGFRARAQEVAHERLGDLSRTEAERRIWRETQADRFTGFDRRLLQAADADNQVDDGIGGSDAWTALMRGRLRHLEALGLAVRVGRRYRLDAGLEPQLRGLQLRRDIIRTLHQRRLDSGREVRVLESGRVQGQVVGRGTHDELGGVGWVFVRDRAGVEHYARLAFGQSAPPLGKSVELAFGPQGARVHGANRSPDLSR